ncbi:MAG: hypothetical protein COS89_06115 [Deltaproteobacteria bacterium CG07_land_8_20_14_0_80_38_7]|nr:MAG: hypothetical protein COS89_06115 [Deltaproteobacteria bacterium CG07_land_8_20_14_0_80_38_7]
MKRLFILSSIITVLLFGGLASARPLKGFNTGPFLYLETGIMQIDFDKDQYNNTNNGDDFEPALGMIFGWNIRDWISAELQGLYTTNSNNDRREHIVGASLCSRYFFITNALTDIKNLKIMPTVKGGMAFRISSLPGNVNSTDSAVTSFGWGPTFGCGINFLIYKYLSIGLEVQEDLLFFDDIRQSLTVNGASLPNTLIYKGGFKPQFLGLFSIGVHY